MVTTTTLIDRRALTTLRGAFRGALLLPGEEGFDETRRIRNGAIDRHPALIARCAGTDDVQTAVRFARERDLPLSVRGGGHGVAGHAVADDGVMIDLSLMKSIQVDPAAQTVRVAGGVLWGEMDQATQRFGLATTGGTISHTGVGGVTLGSGLGHLMRKHGLAVDNLRAVDLVTADGERRHVDADSEPDLFWGLRGGGGNFGIGTALEFDLHPVGPLVLGGPIFWPLDQAPEVLRLIRDFAPEAPDELGMSMAASLAPPLPILPAAWYGRPVLGLILVWAGDPVAGERVIAPLRAIGTPVAELVRPTPYVALQSMLDGGAPAGRHYYWQSHRVPHLADAAIETIIDRVETITSPFSQIVILTTGGAVSRVDPATTALGERPPGFNVTTIAAWAPPGLDGLRHRTWVREGWERLRPYSAGVYPNFLSDEGDAGIVAAYGDRLPRLTMLKNRYDPDNIFRLNANIPPAKRP